MSEHETQTKPVGAFELFGRSSKIVQDNLKVFLILTLLPLIGSFNSSWRTDEPTTQDNISSNIGSFFDLPGWVIGSTLGIATALIIAIIVIALIINAMTVVLVTESAQGKKPDLKHLFNKSLKFWGRLFFLNLLVGIMTVVGLILFIVPGIIVIRRYFLAQYIMVDQDLSVTEAMRKSAELSKPFSLAIWGVIGVGLLLSLPGIIPLIGGPATVILGMMYSVAPTLRYEELKKLSHHVAPGN